MVTLSYLGYFLQNSCFGTFLEHSGHINKCDSPNVTDLQNHIGNTMHLEVSPAKKSLVGEVGQTLNMNVAKLQDSELPREKSKLCIGISVVVHVDRGISMEL